MTAILETLLTKAQAGESVYITDIRNTFATIPGEDSLLVTVALRCLNEDIRVFPLRLPKFLEKKEQEQKLVVEYFLAELYNMLSSLGGRSVTLHCGGHVQEGEFLLEAFRSGFGVGLPTYRRTGYGNCLNVLDRMLPALPGRDGKAEPFSVGISAEPPPAESVAPGFIPPGGAPAVFRNAAMQMDGKTFLGVDIGGTDIKLALAMDGYLVCCKEFDWNPAEMETVEEFVHPVTVLVELMQWTARAERDADEELKSSLRTALDREADVATMKDVVKAAEQQYGAPGVLFDGIGMSFPDVVVGNKIVGGETLKTRGMRKRWGEDYDREYAKLAHLDDTLRGSVTPKGVVGIINDGPMAAFTAGVEMAVASPEDVENGVFAHTLGTELGTGWVTETGGFPDIPLELYNLVIDLGSYPEREFGADDVRSVNNFNTKLSGTPQRYASQSGVFRLAFKLLPKARPDIIEAIREKGFVIEDADGTLTVPTAPRDMRKPFLEFMMELAEKESDPHLNAIFEEIGRALAVIGKETERLLLPAANRRILFGRLVKRAVCFDLMRKGALAYDPAADLAVADETIAETPLMKELGTSRDYTVAQFAQAVGAVYFANYISLQEPVR